MKFDTPLRGNLSISRRERPYEKRKIKNGHSEFDMVLTVTDEESHRKAFELTIDGAEFLNAITNLGYRPCTYRMESGNFDLLGKTKETKTIWIKTKDSYKKDDIPRVPKRWTEEGWEYDSGYGNHHRHEVRDGVAGFNCMLVRYVEPTTEVDFPLEESAPAPRKKKVRK